MEARLHAELSRLRYSLQLRTTIPFTTYEWFARFRQVVGEFDPFVGPLDEPHGRVDVVEALDPLRHERLQQLLLP